ncbi:hypothetical protein K402DRAFT_457511 [Aulographum hederae CBS 113979]|uniref:Apple domain-containing protein n=1 Tax=Aulographum hederae CBS 113979 TaxID=1176131 RepID=A0A6G1GN72_9PEZI|nr:hypothetical protein K402DRAFT_457511 [Aulographum hederae CBS 113979]
MLTGTIALGVLARVAFAYPRNAIEVSTASTNSNPSTVATESSSIAAASTLSSSSLAAVQVLASTLPLDLQSSTEVSSSTLSFDGWLVTPGSTVDNSIAPTSSAVERVDQTSTSASAPVAPSRPLGDVCPRDDGLVYTAPNDGDQFTVECYVDYVAGDFATEWVVNLDSCIAACDASDECEAIAYAPATDAGTEAPCYLKSVLGSGAYKATIIGARRLRKLSSDPSTDLPASTSTTSSSSSSAATDPTLTSSFESVSTSSASASESPLSYTAYLLSAAANLDGTSSPASEIPALKSLVPEATSELNQGAPSVTLRSRQTSDALVVSDEQSTVISTVIAGDNTSEAIVIIANGEIAAQTGPDDTTSSSSAPETVVTVTSTVFVPVPSSSGALSEIVTTITSTVFIDVASIFPSDAVTTLTSTTLVNLDVLDDVTTTITSTTYVDLPDDVTTTITSTTYVDRPTTSPTPYQNITNNNNYITNHNTNVTNHNNYITNDINNITNINAPITLNLTEQHFDTNHVHNITNINAPITLNLTEQHFNTTIVDAIHHHNFFLNVTDHYINQTINNFNITKNYYTINVDVFKTPKCKSKTCQSIQAPKCGWPKKKPCRDRGGYRSHHHPSYPAHHHDDGFLPLPSVLPHWILDLFDNNEINFYYAHSEPVYYVKTCNWCPVVPVSAKTSCFLSSPKCRKCKPEVMQIHYDPRTSNTYEISELDASAGKWSFPPRPGCVSCARKPHYNPKTPMPWNYNVPVIPLHPFHHPGESQHPHPHHGSSWPRPANFPPGPLPEGRVQWPHPAHRPGPHVPVPQRNPTYVTKSIPCNHCAGGFKTKVLTVVSSVPTKMNHNPELLRKPWGFPRPPKTPHAHMPRPPPPPPAAAHKPWSWPSKGHSPDSSRRARAERRYFPVLQEAAEPAGLSSTRIVYITEPEGWIPPTATTTDPSGFTTMTVTVGRRPGTLLWGTKVPTVLPAAIPGMINGVESRDVENSSTDLEPKKRNWLWKILCFGICDPSLKARDTAVEVQQNSTDLEPKRQSLWSRHFCFESCRLRHCPPFTPSLKSLFSRKVTASLESPDVAVQGNTTDIEPKTHSFWSRRFCLESCRHPGPPPLISVSTLRSLFSRNVTASVEAPNVAFQGNATTDLKSKKRSLWSRHFCLESCGDPHVISSFKSLFSRGIVN